MSPKTAVLFLALGALVLALPSCVGSNTFGEDAAGSIPGINPGDEPGDVIAVLGPPKDRASGWWSGDHRFETEFEVWYYKGTGRVVFSRDEGLEVHTSESDPTENGRSWGPR